MINVHKFHYDKLPLQLHQTYYQVDSIQLGTVFIWAMDK
jgi:hypothetical protein